ncbi:tRNA (adenosine(37)-N6)-threonylcarbamoyltransferase complex ATPase subunit type 1 TsaE [Nibricoccus sp. IMCC34717]|uniref:tRNA (adenosine(37)-N6)-threonylcarbamoyltransferase complex ATPase subunit type 1 TsaE n=1 Tax=Nibricoccus sp. IMCC34717 TaxID=3034021 RepID=UPI00384C319F
MRTWADLESGVATRSEAEMVALAADVLPLLPRNATLALHGDLGVGKTTFVRGLARALGLTQAITSPTFTVYNLHRAPSGIQLVHMDAYRLAGAAAVDALMLEDFLTEPYVLAIEWPERIDGWLPKEARHLWFSIEAGPVHRVVAKPQAV